MDAYWKEDAVVFPISVFPIHTGRGDKGDAVTFLIQPMLERKIESAEPALWAQR